MIAPEIMSEMLDVPLKRIAAQAARIDICDRMPNTYAELASCSLGYITQFKISEPVDCAGGRCVMVSNIGDGMVTKRGTPTYYCLTGNRQILDCAPLSDTKEVVPGLTFRLPAFDIEMERGA